MTTDLGICFVGASEVKESSEIGDPLSKGTVSAAGRLGGNNALADTLLDEVDSLEGNSGTVFSVKTSNQASTCETVCIAQF